jgi:ADP-ribosylglycohydrolase
MTQVTGRRTFDNYIACLLGVALGDALGAPIEFLSLPEIRARYGPAGLTMLAPAFGRVGTITDDTQMTLFTADALLRYDGRIDDTSDGKLRSLLREAYLQWLETQGVSAVVPREWLAGGRLDNVEALRHARAPGNTCLSALRAGGMGTVDRPINDSKGCGGVMRVAPVGLVAPPELAFRIGCEAAAITHGHPSGYLAAGAYAAVLSAVVDGASLSSAIATALTLLGRQRRHDETTDAIESAVRAAHSGPASAERVESLGQGWVAEEALAIALYCALVGADFRSGVLLAVNHGGDSDSTGAIAGGLLGALHGRQSQPSEWLAELELRDLIAGIATDLFRRFGGERPDSTNTPTSTDVAPPLRPDATGAAGSNGAEA